MYFVVKAWYVNKKGLSNKSYKYLIDPSKMGEFKYCLDNYLGPNEWGDLAHYVAWQMENTFDSKPKTNPIIIDEYWIYEERPSGEEFRCEITSLTPIGIYDVHENKMIMKVEGENRMTSLSDIWNHGVVTDKDTYWEVDTSACADSPYLSSMWNTSDSPYYNQYSDKVSKTTTTLTNIASSDNITIAGDLTAIKDSLSVAADSISTNICLKGECANYSPKKEEKNMFNKMFKNIEFGKITDGSIKMSIYGPAFRTADGDYMAYSGDEYVDATGFVFDGMDNFCFKMPVGEDNVDIGDFIVHNKKYCRITDLDDNGNWIVEDVYNKEIKTIMSTRSPFGFNFLTKVVTFGEEFFAADSENPFGSILPMMMLFGDGNGFNGDNSMALAMMMMNNTNNIDPMMMYLMCGDSKGNKDMLPMLMMMNSKNNPFNIKKHECKCRGKRAQIAADETVVEMHRE